MNAWIFAILCAAFLVYALYARSGPGFWWDKPLSGAIGRLFGQFYRQEGWRIGGVLVVVLGLSRGEGAIYTWADGFFLLAVGLLAVFLWPKEPGEP